MTWFNKKGWRENGNIFGIAVVLLPLSIVFCSKEFNQTTILESSLMDWYLRFLRLFGLGKLLVS